MFFVLKKRKIVAIVILYSALYLMLYLNSRFKMNELNTKLKVNVLFWTKYYDSDHFVRGHEKGLFQDCPSLADRCRLTNDRSLIEESAAVIFHMRDFNVADLPKFRSPEQRWVFFLMESPPHTHREEILKNLPPKYQFNWTMTYRFERVFYFLLFSRVIWSCFWLLQKGFGYRNALRSVCSRAVQETIT